MSNFDYYGFLVLFSILLADILFMLITGCTFSCMDAHIRNFFGI
jgi:hypothetical protein